MSWLISVTLSLTWALFFAVKSMRLPKHNKAAAVIIEIDLRKINGRIVNVSNIESAKFNRLPNNYPRNLATWAASAREVLLQDVPKEALTGQYWMIRRGTAAGDAALAIVGGDHQWPNLKTGKFDFGCFSRWAKEGFDKVAYTPAKEKALFKGLLERKALEVVAVDVARARRPSERTRDP